MPVLYAQGPKIKCPENQDMAAHICILNTGWEGIVETGQSLELVGNAAELVNLRCSERIYLNKYRKQESKKDIQHLPWASTHM